MIKTFVALMVPFCLLNGQVSSKNSIALPLPIVLRCGFNGPYLIRTEYALSSAEAKFSPDWHLAGTIETGTNISAFLFYIVGDLQYPFIITYDGHKRQIDSLYLVLGDCFDQPTAIERTTTTITQALVVQMTDSLFVAKNSTEGSGEKYSLQVKRRDYRLKDNGRFIVAIDTTYMVPNAQAPK